MEDYVLISWPESQELMEMKGFEEHSSLADCEQFGPCAYFVEKEWLESDEEEEEDDSP